MKKKIKKLYLQQKKRFLKKIQGTAQKPRLAIFKSHQHIYAQLINDDQAFTLAFSSTLDKDIIEKRKNLSPKEVSFLVGINLAEKAMNKGISSIVFDRGSRPYLGRIQNLAQGARKQGLIF